MIKQPPSFSDHEIALLMQTAQTLPPQIRGAWFLEAVALRMSWGEDLTTAILRVMARVRTKTFDLTPDPAPDQTQEIRYATQPG